MRTRRLIPWSQSEVKDHVEWLVQDTGNLRWSEPDIYKAINVALRGWSQRVKIPKLHNLADGFTAGVNEYTIPDYIGQNFYPRIKSSIITLLQVQQDDSTFNWLDAISAGASCRST